MKIINERKKCSHRIKDLLLIAKCRKTLIRLGIYFIFLGVAALIALLPNVLSRDKGVSHSHARFKTDLKYILIWKHHKKNKKNFFSKDVTYLEGQTQFIKQNCPYINCYVSYNRCLLHEESDFDAIVFSIHDIKKLNMYNVNLGRSAHQKYIFKSFESAEKHPICNSMIDDFFNWTWTFRLDSDVPHPFISVYDSKNNLVGPNKTMNWITDVKNTNKYKSLIRGKTKHVAWIVSNCKLKNKYQDFVTDLAEELKGYNYSLDVLGPCSDLKCPKGGIIQCYKMIERDYFFNLVLEESFEDDYVTEKMVKAMTYLTVPIVYGSNFTSFLPPGSYINAKLFDFKQLGAVLDYLMKNPRKYSYFFDWKTYYHYTARPKSHICDLCTKLNTKGEMKTYNDFRRWWNPEYEDTCQRIKLYNLFQATP